MTAEEKDLALRMYERVMVTAEALGEYGFIARDCVRASKYIYQAIAAEDDADMRRAEEESEAERKRMAEEEEAERKREEGQPKYYLTFKEYISKDGDYNADICIKKTVRELDKFLHIELNCKVREVYKVGMYRISKEDANKLFKAYRTSDAYKQFNVSEQLKGNTENRFEQYVSECPSAKHINLTDFPIKAVKL